MMLEYIIGFVCGMALGIGIMAVDCYRHKAKRRVDLEKEYVVLNDHVNQASACIERIINGSQP
jgi:hypothetical protein